MAELIRSNIRHLSLADESAQCCVTSSPLLTCSHPGCERQRMAKGIAPSITPGTDGG